MWFSRNFHNSCFSSDIRHFILTRPFPWGQGQDVFKVNNIDTRTVSRGCATAFFVGFEQVITHKCNIHCKWRPLIIVLPDFVQCKWRPLMIVRLDFIHCKWKPLAIVLLDFKPFCYTPLANIKRTLVFWHFQGV